MTTVAVRWTSSRLRGLYPVYSDGITYLCRQETGETKGVIFGDGSGYWVGVLTSPVRGPRNWRSSAQPGARIRVVRESAGWRWEISPAPSRRKAS